MLPLSWEWIGDEEDRVAIVDVIVRQSLVGFTDPGSQDTNLVDNRVLFPEEIIQWRSGLVDRRKIEDQSPVFTNRVAQVVHQRAKWRVRVLSLYTISKKKSSIRICFMLVQK